MKEGTKTIECKICGAEFTPTKEMHYIAREKGITGLTVIVKNDESEIYDAFDCPQCGCQLVAQNRYRDYFREYDYDEDITEDDESEEVNNDKEWEKAESPEE